MSSSTTLAIDFGTTNSLVGAWKDGQRVEAFDLDPFATDSTLMRTLLYFPHQDECFYGAEAIQQFIDKEMEGRLFRSFKSHLPNENYLGTVIGNRVLPLEKIVGIFLLELKKRAEKILEQSTDRAVIGRPARYSLDPVADGFALHRMQKAAEFAGFKDVTFVAEPLAAALDYRRSLTEEKIVLIGDFGGGTSDFTLIRMGPYAFEKEHVLGLDGCPLAGDALDSLFMSQRLNEFFGAKVRYKMALGKNWMEMPKSVMQRLNQPAHIVHLKEKSTYEFIKDVQKGAANDSDKAHIQRLFNLIEDQQIFSFFEHIESSKRRLSERSLADFVFNYPGIEVSSTFLREEFEKWAEVPKEKIFASLDTCMNQAQISNEKVDLVYLTGGSAQVPLIREVFESRFGKDKLKSQSHFHSVLSGLIESAAF